VKAVAFWYAVLAVASLGLFVAWGEKWLLVAAAGSALFARCCWSLEKRDSREG
jgi:hypothetical protein